MTKRNADNNKDRKEGRCREHPGITKDCLRYMTPESACSPVHCVPLVIMSMY